MKKQYILSLFLFIYIMNFTHTWSLEHQHANITKIRLEDISFFSKALNIEGLHKINEINNHNRNIITSYFTLILDTPGKIIKKQKCGIELSEKIHASPRGGRMENEIPQFHEEQANLFWLIILQMYIEKAHIFTKKDKNEAIFLTIHLHRGKSAISHMEVLKKIFIGFFNVPASTIVQKTIKTIPVMQFKIPKKNIYVTIQGDKRDMHKIYIPSNQPCDIFLAFGFVGALDHKLSSGDIVIPVGSIEFDLEKLTINLAKETTGDNHLLKVLPQYIEEYQTVEALKFCNDHLYSPFKKRKKVSKYKLDDLHFLKILSVKDSFFVPSLLQKACGTKYEKSCITLIK